MSNISTTNSIVPKTEHLPTGYIFTILFIVFFCISYIVFTICWYLSYQSLLQYFHNWTLYWESGTLTIMTEPSIYLPYILIFVILHTIMTIGLLYSSKISAYYTYILWWTLHIIMFILFIISSMWLVLRSLWLSNGHWWDLFLVIVLWVSVIWWFIISLSLLALFPVCKKIFSGTVFTLSKEVRTYITITIISSIILSWLYWFYHHQENKSLEEKNREELIQQWYATPWK